MNLESMTKHCLLYQHGLIGYTQHRLQLWQTQACLSYFSDNPKFVSVNQRHSSINKSLPQCHTDTHYIKPFTTRPRARTPELLCELLQTFFICLYLSILNEIFSSLPVIPSCKLQSFPARLLTLILQKVADFSNKFSSTGAASSTPCAISRSSPFKAFKQLNKRFYRIRLDCERWYLQARHI